ncbi:MAG: NUDIX domain-containing protein [Ignavibacteria bacterium]
MKLATLLYIKNDKGEYLLMERLKDPNKGLMSPPGGKLNDAEAESPAGCAVREAFEECSIKSTQKDWKLMGIVTDKNYPAIGNIMLFLMSYTKNLNQLPPECNEGAFKFIHPDNFKEHKLPVTDKLFLWEMILKNDPENFFLSLDCSDYPDIKLIKY